MLFRSHPLPLPQIPHTPAVCLKVHIRQYKKSEVEWLFPIKKGAVSYPIPISALFSLNSMQKNKEYAGTHILYFM